MKSYATHENAIKAVRKAVPNITDEEMRRHLVIASTVDGRYAALWITTNSERLMQMMHGSGGVVATTNGGGVPDFCRSIGESIFGKAA